MRFLDANVILRYLTRDDEVKAGACYTSLTRGSEVSARSRGSIYRLTASTARRNSLTCAALIGVIPGRTTSVQPARLRPAAS